MLFHVMQWEEVVVALVYNAIRMHKLDKEQAVTMKTFVKDCH